LTDDCPKPLIKVRGETLIDRHLSALSEAGFREIVINVHHLADQIIEHVGDGSRFGISISVSRESEALETAGGIRKALSFLGDGPFAVISCDVYTDYPYDRLRRDLKGRDAHLVMVDNPSHHPGGDFSLDPSGLIGVDGDKLTYSGIGVYESRFFDDVVDGEALKLRALMDPAIVAGRLSGEHYKGSWDDVGTPERLARLNR
jgi:MurNAc alpha-1-phosphate uridylyltransferase